MRDAYLELSKRRLQEALEERTVKNDRELAARIKQTAAEEENHASFHFGEACSQTEGEPECIKSAPDSEDAAHSSNGWSASSSST